MRIDECVAGHPWELQASRGCLEPRKPKGTGRSGWQGSGAHVPRRGPKGSRGAEQGFRREHNRPLGGMRTGQERKARGGGQGKRLEEATVTVTRISSDIHEGERAAGRGMEELGSSQRPGWTPPRLLGAPTC